MATPTIVVYINIACSRGADPKGAFHGTLNQWGGGMQVSSSSPFGEEAMRLGKGASCMAAPFHAINPFHFSLLVTFTPIPSRIWVRRAMSGSGMGVSSTLTP